MSLKERRKKNEWWQWSLDFMIHGIVKYHLFGHELWLTTTTVGMTIVTIVLLILVIAANRALKHATDVPGTFQNIMNSVWKCWK